jgi:hypothetical protein
MAQSVPAVASGAGRGGLFASPVSPFSARQPPRLFAMAGMPPVMAPSRMAPQGMGSQGMGLGQQAAIPGRGLDFYRGAPIRTIMPMGQVLRVPNMVMR